MTDVKDVPKVPARRFTAEEIDGIVETVGNENPLLAGAHSAWDTVASFFRALWVLLWLTALIVGLVLLIWRRDASDLREAALLLASALVVFVWTRFRRS